MQQYRSIKEIFDAFQQLNILVIGDVMVDAYIWGTVDRISPEAPVPIIKSKDSDFRLGGAANVALNLHALGANAIVCALVGQGTEGRKLFQRLEEKGLDTSGIVISKERPTTVKTRVIAGNHHMIRIDEEEDGPASDSESQALLEKIKTLLPTCQAVIFEDYDKGCITPALIQETISLAKSLDIPTVVDPKKRNFQEYVGVTLFKPNLKELREGLKIDFDAKDIEQVAIAVEQLKEVLHSDGVLVTLSELGVYIDYQQEQHRIPAHLREIADVSGAGDTVISIAGLCIALGLSPKFIAQLSNLGGGLVCEHVGVVPINKEGLEKEAMDKVLL